jgi:hypothetical protein
MTVQKVGYVVLSASGYSLKLYEGFRFIGTVSLSDIEKLKKHRKLVATIVKFPKPNGLKIADPKKLSDNQRFLNALS